jgi:ankyrin repeat protein
MRVLGLLLAASGCVWPASRPDNFYTSTKSVLHQICDLPKAWFHLRRPLIIFALDYYGRERMRAPSSPLHTLVEIRDPKTLRFFLKTSDTQYLDDHLQRKNEGGRSPLGTAIGQVESEWARSLDIVQALLQQGASLDDTSVVSPLPLSSPRSGGFFRVGFRGTTIRDIAMRSNRDDLKELVAKF